MDPTFDLRISSKSFKMKERAVSSAVRASGLHPEGPPFESEIAHHQVFFAGT